MKKVNQLKNIDEMDKKLSLVLDLLDQECNGDGIILNYVKYLQFLALLEDIVQLWDTVNIENDTTEKVYISLIIINEDFFKINKKYYDDPYI
jgi:hypothetical protein